MPGNVQVTLTLLCERCASRTEIRVPIERGLQQGTYYWKCTVCKAKDRDEEEAGGIRNRNLRGKDAKRTQGKSRE